MKRIQLSSTIIFVALSLFSCQTKNAQVEQNSIAPIETVYLLIQEEAQAEQLITDFSKYGLQLIGRSSRAQLQYKYLYDANLVEKKSFKKLLLEHTAILEVIFVTDQPGDISTGTNDLSYVL